MLRSEVHALHGEGKFVGAGDGLDDDVFVFDAVGFEGVDAAGEEGGDDGRVPAGVYYAYSKTGPCKTSSVEMVENIGIDVALDWVLRYHRRAGLRLCLLVMPLSCALSTGHSEVLQCCYRSTMESRAAGGVAAEL